MSNSSLATYSKMSPNNSGTRTHTIDTVSVHCVVGQCAIETLGSLFAKSTYKASSNYGIGYDGKIGMFVPESKRSWCTSSASNDQRAITIEVASDTTSPYRVKDAAYNALIKLLADICRRNPGISMLRWQGKSSLIGQTAKQNMTVHRWFASKACPGDYLYNLHGQIAKEVNALLAQKIVYLECQGDAVKEWQELLIKRGYSCGDSGADGVFGSSTDGAVRKFQKDNGLTVDGVVGAKTQAALKLEETPAVEETETKQPEADTKAEEAEATATTIVRLDKAEVFAEPPVLTNVTGAFTIVATQDGYGKLKSGAGWVKMPTSA